MLIEIFIFVVTCMLTYYLYTHKKIVDNYKKNGVKYIPGVPIFGNVLRSTFKKCHMVDDIDAVYRKFPNEKYVGYIEGTANIIMIRDPELIKRITVKDFDHFVNHRQFVPPETDPLFGESVLMLKDEKWRDMRTTLSPAFTGSKMRLMMPFMEDISRNIVEYLKEHQSEDIDAQDLVRRYTNDVIASAGFGVQVNSLKDRENEFYVMGKDIFKFDLKMQISFFIAAQFPELTKKLGLPMFSNKMEKFLKKMVSSTMEYRIQNNVERPDMIQLLIEASKGTLKSEKDDKEKIGFATVDEGLENHTVTRKWTQDQLAAQVFIFFVAGYESSANGLIMCIHELAINPKVQEQLYQEVMTFKEKYEKLTYDNLQELKYLDCVLNETLRKWSPAIILDRVCSKPYELPPSSEGAKPYRLQKGDIVYNCVNSIHMDPEHYPDPEQFNPDRFSDENKHNIKPFTFMPFGIGPRNCIASRFALMEIKVLLFNMIANFKLVKTAKTASPIALQPGGFNIAAKGGTWIQFEART